MKTWLVKGKLSQTQITVEEALLDTGSPDCHIKSRIADALGLSAVPLKENEEPEYGLTFGGATADPLASYEVTVELLGMSHDVIAKVGMLEHPRAKDMIIGRLLLHHYKMEWNVPLGSFTVTPLSDSKP